MMDITKSTARSKQSNKKINSLLLSLILLSMSGICSAQNLAIVNFSGTTVGWLVSKVPDTTYSMYLTPDGWLLTINNRGTTLNSVGERPERLEYESNDCTGAPWIYVGQNSLFSKIQGEVFQIGTIEDSLHARMPRSSIPLNKDFLSRKEGDGVCTPYQDGDDINMNALQVEEVDPLDYGITESEAGKWGVKIPSFEMQQQLPEVISCDSFESCPEL